MFFQCKTISSNYHGQTINPFRATLNDLLRGVEQITRLEMTQVLNGQQVRRRFATSRHLNNNLLQNALQDIRNGGDPVQYLRRVGHINESYINQMLGPIQQPEVNRQRIGPNHQINWNGLVEEF
ncbi:uncharacterized protein LOC126835166 [Adelges cooleyi]|uniref:uncharacterized protein LOC126835166 n=1 Tax=Adelges cooleyi TaxID=133065 RepID=UPI00217F2420|nr:uncharacterized protein LOC126835166 [Adelges cooleyi]